jgi:hypothetical protein
LEGILVPKFDGDSLGGDLAYDFTRFGHPDIKGVVPEPSRFAAKRFFKEVQQVMKSLDLVNEEDKDKDSASPDDIVKAMNAVDDEEMFDKLTDGVTDCLALSSAVADATMRVNGVLGMAAHPRHESVDGTRI